MNISYINKTIIALLFGAMTTLVDYPHINWQQAALAGVQTVLVYLVPNTPKNDSVQPTASSPSNLVTESTEKT